MTKHVLKTFDERFWGNVEKTEGCWWWVPTKEGNKYGSFLLGGRGSKRVYAHRASYELHHGAIPPGMEVMHTCDNPSCVNPSHLLAGTRSDNMQDCLNKGRWGKTGPKKGTGAKSDLTSVQLAALFKDAETMSQNAVAAKYGIGQSTVSRILLGQSHQNVTVG